MVLGIARAGGRAAAASADSTPLEPPAARTSHVPAQQQNRAIRNDKQSNGGSMPFSTRSHDTEPRQYGDRRVFRSLTDFKRLAKGSNGRNGRPAPPEQTNAENFYYLKQMSTRTPMVVVLTDGEEIRGWIEWYDREALKVNREGAPNLLIQKHCIKYIYKQNEL
jgi:sRNA-binding regulator protein Hfq